MIDVGYLHLPDTESIGDRAMDLVHNVTVVQVSDGPIDVRLMGHITIPTHVLGRIPSDPIVPLTICAWLPWLGPTLTHEELTAMMVGGEVVTQYDAQ